MSRKDPGPTIRRRMLGTELRTLRLSHDLSLDEVTKQLAWSAAKLSRIETARTAASANDVRTLLDHYRITGKKRREDLIGLTRDPRKSQGWWTDFSDVVPGKRWSFVKLEDDAEEIRSYEVEYIPGLLQTREYAEFCFRIAYPTATKDVVERHASARMVRQQLLERDDAPLIWSIVNVGALSRVAAMPEEVAHGQFQRLLDTMDLPRVTLQFLPLSISPHPGQTGTFTLLRFPEPGGEVVHLDTLTGSFYLEEPQQIESYAAAFRHLETRVLSKTASRQHVRGLMRQCR